MTTVVQNKEQQGKRIPYKNNRQKESRFLDEWSW
jgi:hypothetical protein